MHILDLFINLSLDDVGDGIDGMTVFVCQVMGVPSFQETICDFSTENDADNFRNDFLLTDQR